MTHNTKLHQILVLKTAVLRYSPSTLPAVAQAAARDAQKVFADYEVPVTINRARIVAGIAKRENLTLAAASVSAIELFEQWHGADSAEHNWGE